MSLHLALFHPFLIILYFYFLSYFKNKKFSFDWLIYAFDFFIFVFVIFYLLTDISYIFISVFKGILDMFNINLSEYISYVGDSSGMRANTNTINTTIIHNDGSWSNAIRTIFIYGTGAFRLSLLPRGGSPGSRAFIIGSTIVADSMTKILNNTINDPSYVKNHAMNWKAVWSTSVEGEVEVQVDEQTLNQINSASNNSFISSNDINNILNNFISGLFENLKYILEPVQANYSNEILANQIYDLSIILFILSILIIVLILALLFNILLLINMDRIIKFFNNKYIKWYLLLNKKFISIEVFILGISIISFMFSLSKGILFIATHPIIL